MLIKRSHIAALVLIALVFPATALAVTAGGGGGAPAIAPAEPAPALEPLQRTVDNFHQVIDTISLRIQKQRAARVAAEKAERKRERRERWAELPGGVLIETLDSIAACESGGDPEVVSSDGSYRGKYQFDFGTWESVGGSGDPAAAPEDEQDYRAALLYTQSGSSPWPVCG